MRFFLLITCILHVTSADQASLSALEKRIQKMDARVDSLLRQTVLTNLAMEENVRSEGDSGLKNVGLYMGGTRNYHSNSLVVNMYTPGSLSLHDPFKSDRIATSSFNAVLNGIDFKYGGSWIHMNVPHASSKTYLATQQLEHPDVPPEVLKQPTVEGQVKEMKEWFRAFRDQNIKHRDFRKYFKPVVCYLEGWWEDVSSAAYHRKLLLARTQAIANIRYSYHPWYSLPKQVWESTTDPIKFSEFKTRVMCQPIKNIANLNPNRFILVDDMSVRVPKFQKLSDYARASYARFTVNPTDSSRFYDRAHRAVLLDKIMENVPGLDNGAGNLRDVAFDTPAQRFENSKIPLNTAKYHRFYKVQRKGAMGSFDRHRGYTDASIFMAQTSQSRVASQTVEDCQYVNRKRVCKSYTQKFSYAVPLFVTYLTPLHKWNPYKLPLMTEKEQRKRSGRNSVNTAYTGYSRIRCSTIPADLIQHESPVYATSGNKVYPVNGCGYRYRIIVKDLGLIRLTFPIFPTYHEGNAVMKEVTALQDMILDQAKYKSLWRTSYN